ncbi:GNAT family N-acetyltransferase [Candidatus Roizmanbacteria bacterium]|nr:GNAT family N-acetyltransferase [Candidatus Roizmanbacteria bacterium]
MNIHIRPATEQDLAQCEKLAKHPYLEFPGGGFPDKEYMKAFISEYYFLVADREGKIVGWILGESLKTSGVGLWFFVVDEHFRGKGIGKMLFQEFEKRLRSAKRKWIFLTAHINNDIGINFYKEMGFVKGKPHFEMVKIL